MQVHGVRLSTDVHELQASGVEVIYEQLVVSNYLLGCLRCMMRTIRTEAINKTFLIDRLLELVIILIESDHPVFSLSLAH